MIRWRPKIKDNRWRDPLDLLPDWGDGGRRVEVMFDDGDVAAGELVICDELVTDDGDEVPIFQFVLDGGCNVGFFDVCSWRYA